MKIAALQKISLIDYPGKISTVIFTQGCNFRCGYCHNPQLVLPRLFGETIDEKIILEYLSKRKGKIEGVVITGGEPTIHKDLPDLIRKIKMQGFPIKLDTNGSNPEMLKILFDEKLIDFVAMDVKTTFDKYSQLCGVNVDTRNITESINLIKNSSASKQFRITLLKGIHDINQIAQLENTLGIKLSLQEFRYIPPLLSDNFNQSHVLPIYEIKRDKL